MRDERATGSGAIGWLHRADDFVFQIEQGITATALMVMSVIVFLDVVARRMLAQESQVGGWLAALFGVEDAAGRATLDGAVAPAVTISFFVLVVWAGLISSYRMGGKPLLAFKGGTLVMAAVIVGVAGGLAWLMVAIEPKLFLSIVWVAAALAYALDAYRTKHPGWAPRVGSTLFVVTPLVVWFCFTFVPEDYTWSKELALLLLLWVGFFGMSVCARGGKHMRLEAFEKLLPASIARFVLAGGYLLAASFCAFMALLGQKYVLRSIEFESVFGEQIRIPDWAGMGVVPLAFGLTALRFIAAAISMALGGHYGKPAVDDSLKEAEALAEKKAEAAS